MFGRKTRDEIKLLEDRLVRHREQMAEMEKALNEVTRLLAKKHGLKLHVSCLMGWDSPSLVRLATRTKTKHIKL